jgi:hypothetical protein
MLILIYRTYFYHNHNHNHDMNTCEKNHSLLFRFSFYLPCCMKILIHVLTFFNVEQDVLYIDSWKYFMSYVSLSTLTLDRHLSHTYELLGAYSLLVWFFMLHRCLFFHCINMETFVISAKILKLISIIKERMTHGFSYHNNVLEWI